MSFGVILGVIHGLVEEQMERTEHVVQACFMRLSDVGKRRAVRSYRNCK